MRPMLRLDQKIKQIEKPGGLGKPVKVWNNPQKSKEKKWAHTPKFGFGYKKGGFDAGAWKEVFKLQQNMTWTIEKHMRQLKKAHGFKGRAVMTKAQRKAKHSQEDIVEKAVEILQGSLPDMLLPTKMTHPLFEQLEEKLSPDDCERLMEMVCAEQEGILAASVIHYMRMFQIPRTTAHYRWCFEAPARAARWEAARSLLNWMSEDGIQPDEYIKGLYVLTLGMSSKSHNATTEFNQIKASGNQPNVHAYNGMLASYITTGQASLANKTITEMRVNGVQANNLTSHLLHKIYASGGYPERIELLLASMAGKYVNQPELWFESLMYAYMNKNDTEGIKNALARGRTMVRTEALDRLQSVAVQAMGATGDFYQTAIMLEEMDRKASPAPSGETYALALEAAVELENWPDADTLLKIMDEKGFRQFIEIGIKDKVKMQMESREEMFKIQEENNKDKDKPLAQMFAICITETGLIKNQEVVGWLETRLEPRTEDKKIWAKYKGLGINATETRLTERIKSLAAAQEHGKVTKAELQMMIKAVATVAEVARRQSRHIDGFRDMAEKLEKEKDKHFSYKTPPKQLPWPLIDPGNLVVENEPNKERPSESERVRKKFTKLSKKYKLSLAKKKTKRKSVWRSY